VLKKIHFTSSIAGLKPNISSLNSIYEHICFFDSNQPSNPELKSKYAQLLAIGNVRELVLNDAKNIFDPLRSFLEANNGWIFGYMSYDLKNATEDLQSDNPDSLEFPLLHFFSPLVVIEIFPDTRILNYRDEFISEGDAKRIYDLAFSENIPAESQNHLLGIQNRITRTNYTTAFENLKKHISRGDIYEMNFCQEFFAEKAVIDPVTMYNKLNSISAAPFSAFCRFREHYVLSSSPERFLKKEGAALISQPIKGTIRRSTDKREDEELKRRLRNDLKEQNENVMIVDLVRNDLSRIAKRGTVKVDELFGIYSFLQVHQMISTVSCEVPPDISFDAVIKAAFPMGSMTGAPKVRAMELIEKYESTRRGLYSGALGYIDPQGDFDFSVVIRSILYNASRNYLSFMTGSAITANAEADKEYEECLLKAKAMFEALK
jgi:para-aminobenzoate synthetase component I